MIQVGEVCEVRCARELIGYLAAAFCGRVGWVSKARRFFLPVFSLSHDLEVERATICLEVLLLVLWPKG